MRPGNKALLQRKTIGQGRNLTVQTLAKKRVQQARRNLSSNVRAKRTLLRNRITQIQTANKVIINTVNIIIMFFSTETNTNQNI